MNVHTCHARNCTRTCAPERLMCLDHWRMVPRDIQRSVWASYRPGQCDDKRPSTEWHVAADAAIAAVAIREGLATPEDALYWLERHGPVDVALLETVRRAVRR